MRDIVGISATKIFRLYKDKTLSENKLKQLIKEILLECLNERLEDKNKFIETLRKDLEDFRLVKSILRK